MGQVCSRRKRKVSDDVRPTDVISATPTTDTAPVDDSSKKDILKEKLGMERFEMLAEYWSYLKKNRVTVKEEDLEELFDPSKRNDFDLFNVYLMDVSRFSERLKMMAPGIQLAHVVFPVYFDFLMHIEFFPSMSGSVFHASNRPLLLGWYLNQCLEALSLTSPSTQLAHDHALLVIALAVRSLLGKSPKSTLPADLGATVSESVALLLSFHRLVVISRHVGMGLKEILKMSASDLGDIIMKKFENTKVLRDFLDEMGTIHHSYNGIVQDVQSHFPDLPLGLVSELGSLSIEQVVCKWFVSLLEKPAVSHRARKQLVHVWKRAFELLEQNVVAGVAERESLIIASIFSEIPAGKDELKIFQRLSLFLPANSSEKAHIDTLISNSEKLIDFFGISKRYSLNQLQKLREASPEKRELFLESTIKAGLKQWLISAAENPSQFVMTMKGTEFWWTHFVSHTEEINALVCSDSLYELLGREIFQFAVANEFRLNREMHVGNDRVASTFRTVIRHLPSERVRSIARTFLVSSDITADIKDVEVFLKLMIPGHHIDRELKLISLLHAVRDLAFSASKTAPHKGRNFINIIQSAISDKERSRRSELIAQSVHSAEYLRLNNLVSLEESARTDPKRIFDNLFVFNPLSFFQTEKVQNLCRLLHVEQTNNPVWVQVLHYAAAAYIETGEAEGAISLVTRLVNDFRYKDSWRLVINLKHRIGHVSGDLINAALSLCPESELEALISSIVPDSGPPRNIGQVDYVREFPDLNDGVAVDAFIERVGSGFVSYETAELLGSMPSMIEFTPMVASVRKSALLGC